MNHVRKFLSKFKYNLKKKLIYRLQTEVVIKTMQFSLNHYANLNARDLSKQEGKHTVFSIHSYLHNLTYKFSFIKINTPTFQRKRS